VTISRRALLTGGTSLAALGLLSACFPSPTPDEPTPTMVPPTPSPSTPPAPAPGVISSFGPNGSHYPEHTPRLDAVAAREIEVACDWREIALAVGSVTAAQAAAGVAIRVRPGTLVGAGSGSRTTPVLLQLGDPAWERNVLICPRDGYGSVVMRTDGFRIDQCARLSLFGFRGDDVGFVLTNCLALEVGWGRWSTANITQSGASIAFYELVVGFRRDDNDTVGIRPTDANEMTDISRYGCVFGPSVKPDGSDAHLDTLQLERTGAGAFGPFLSVDCVDFGSSNAAIVAHTSLSLAEFRHCLVLAEDLPWKIYDLEPGDYQGRPNALAGGAPDVRFSDSYICGPLGRLGYTEVQNTSVSYQPAESQYPTTGTWTVDPSIAGWSGDDIRAVAGRDFTMRELESHWGW
jgi:hypothetical protein